MTNGELYAIAGRDAAVRDYIKWRRRRYQDEPSEIEVMMGWDGCCQKCGHPANEEDILNDE